MAIDSLNFHQQTPIYQESNGHAAMIAALIRFVQVADARTHDWKYGQIKWGICTGSGYTRPYADAVAALLIEFGGDIPPEIEIDRPAVRAIKLVIEDNLPAEIRIVEKSTEQITERINCDGVTPEDMVVGVRQNLNHGEFRAEIVRKWPITPTAP